MDVLTKSSRCSEVGGLGAADGSIAGLDTVVAPSPIEVFDEAVATLLDIVREGARALLAAAAAELEGTPAPSACIAKDLLYEFQVRDVLQRVVGKHEARLREAHRREVLRLQEQFRSMQDFWGRRLARAQVVRPMPAAETSQEKLCPKSPPSEPLEQTLAAGVSAGRHEQQYQQQQQQPFGAVEGTSSQVLLFASSDASPEREPPAPSCLVPDATQRQSLVAASDLALIATSVGEYVLSPEEASASAAGAAEPPTSNEPIARGGWDADNRRSASEETGSLQAQPQSERTEPHALATAIERQELPAVTFGLFNHQHPAELPPVALGNGSAELPETLAINNCSGNGRTRSRSPSTQAHLAALSAAVGELQAQLKADFDERESKNSGGSESKFGQNSQLELSEPLGSRSSFGGHSRQRAEGPPDLAIVHPPPCLPPVTFGLFNRPLPAQMPQGDVCPRGDDYKRELHPVLEPTEPIASSSCSSSRHSRSRSPSTQAHIASLAAAFANVQAQLTANAEAMGRRHTPFPKEQRNQHSIDSKNCPLESPQSEELRVSSSSSNELLERVEAREVPLGATAIRQEPQAAGAPEPEAAEPPAVETVTFGLFNSQRRAQMPWDDSKREIHCEVYTAKPPEPVAPVVDSSCSSNSRNFWSSCGSEAHHEALAAALADSHAELTSSLIEHPNEPSHGSNKGLVEPPKSDERWIRSPQSQPTEPWSTGSSGISKLEQQKDAAEHVGAVTFGLFSSQRPAQLPQSELSWWQWDDSKRVYSHDCPARLFESVQSTASTSCRNIYSNQRCSASTQAHHTELSIAIPGVQAQLSAVAEAPDRKLPIVTMEVPNQHPSHSNDRPVDSPKMDKRRIRSSSTLYAQDNWSPTPLGQSHQRLEEWTPKDVQAQREKNLEWEDFVAGTLKWNQRDSSGGSSSSPPWKSRQCAIVGATKASDLTSKQPISTEVESEGFRSEAETESPATTPPVSTRPPMPQDARSSWTSSESTTPSRNPFRGLRRFVGSIVGSGRTAGP